MKIITKLKKYKMKTMVSKYKYQINNIFYFNNLIIILIKDEYGLPHYKGNLKRNHILENRKKIINQEIPPKFKTEIVKENPINKKDYGKVPN